MNEIWKIYEHYCIQFHQKNWHPITWHWSHIPEEELEKCGFINSYNKHRLKRLETRKENGPNPYNEYGLDGLAYDEERDEYYGLQMKHYTNRRVTANDLGSFINVIFARLRTGGFLYTHGKLEINLRDDLLCGEMIHHIQLPFNEKSSQLEENINVDESKLSLRPWQEECLNILKNEQKEYQSWLEESDIMSDEESSVSSSESYPQIKVVSACPGSGKTLLIGHYYGRNNNFPLIVAMAPLKTSVTNLEIRLRNFLPDYEYLVVDSDYGENTTTDPEIILQKLETTSKLILFTTYDSAENILENIISHELRQQGSILIDELHNIIHNKELCEFANTFGDGLAVSGTVPEEILDVLDSKIVYKYSVASGIRDGVVVDYNIWLPLLKKLDENETTPDIDIPEDFKDNEITAQVLFLITGMLKTGSRRCIVYLSSKEQCEEFGRTFSEVCEKYHGCLSYVQHVDCEVSRNRRQKIFNNFQEDIRGPNTLYILTSIRILDEAIDIVKCDSEFIGNPSENAIRFVQRLMRGGRRDVQNPLKKNNMFLWASENSEIVNMFSLLKEEDPEYHKKLRICDGSYDKNDIKMSKKNVRNQIKELREYVEIKCLNSEELFERKVKNIREFVERYEELPKKKGERENEKTLFNFLKKNREFYRKKKLSQFRIDLLETIPGFVWRRYKKNLSQEEWTTLLQDFVKEKERVPECKEEYQDYNLGKWYARQKAKITSISSSVYKKLSKIDNIVKVNLDEYFLKKEQNKDKKKLSPEEWLTLFREFVKEKERVPKDREKYQDYNLGGWYANQKTKITSKDSEVYQQLSEVNDVVKVNLDEYLSKKGQNKDKKNLSQEEWTTLLQDFVKEKERVPKCREKYQDYNLGNWYPKQKEKITSKDSEVYQQLSKIDNIVKVNLDEYLSRKETNTFQESLKIFREFVEKEKKVPKQREKYQDYNLGGWYANQKRKITSKDSEVYQQLSEVNEVVKAKLDNYLSNKN